MPAINTIGSADIDGSSASPLTITTTRAVLAGARVLVVVSDLNGDVVPSVSGGGLTWETDQNVRASDDARLTILGAQAPAGLATGTVLTVSYSGGHPNPRMAQALYIGNVVALDAVAQAEGTGADWAVPITTAVDSAAVLAVGMNQNGHDSAAVAEGWVELADFNADALGSGTIMVVLDGAASEAGAYAPGGSFVSATHWSAVAAAYSLSTPVRGTRFPWTWTTGVRSLRNDLYCAIELPALVGEELSIVDSQVAELKAGNVVEFSTAQLRSFYPTGTEHPALPADLDASRVLEPLGRRRVAPGPVKGLPAGTCPPRV